MKFLQLNLAFLKMCRSWADSYHGKYGWKVKENRKITTDQIRYYLKSGDDYFGKSISYAFTFYLERKSHRISVESRIC